MIALIYLGYVVILLLAISPPFFEFLKKKKTSPYFSIKTSELIISGVILVLGLVFFYFDLSYLAIILVVSGNRYLESEVKRRIPKAETKKITGDNWKF